MPLKIEHVQYSFINEPAELQVPDLGHTTAIPTSAIDQENLDDHLTWRTYTEPWNTGGEEALVKASAKEVGIVRNAFPHVSSPEAMLAMAAWFSVLLIVDDLVESMGVGDAREALTVSIKILRGSCLAASEEPNKPIVKVFHVIRSLWTRIHYLLDQDLAQAMLKDIRACLEGQLAELQYRNTPCTSLAEYACIRRHSIGAMPFLTLTCLELSREIPNRQEKLLRHIKDIVVSIVFLQNDLVGLEKDLKEEATMNAFMVRSRSRATSPIPTLQDIRELAHQHNTMVSEALFICRSSCGFEDSEGYRLAVASVVSFISTHLTWAKKSKRYDVA
ncbi:hypothetical protein GTA08_BOTSDO05894 [Botryosphaeria dothidea]|uniref:Terpene synthase n=1 Tax=Botryosphaeria dothidea TaxID=55169 RepID=A0A8H4IWZ5_9PEZI|nr:hypothetical protein GTA08_BOTSDO05894 [Botryosphaeria dothidea]